MNDDWIIWVAVWDGYYYIPSFGAWVWMGETYVFSTWFLGVEVFNFRMQKTSVSAVTMNFSNRYSVGYHVAQIRIRVLTSGRWSDLWLRVVIRDCKWEICWEVEGKISLCNVKWVKLFCQRKHWYSKSDGFGDVLCAGSSGEWVTSTSFPKISCIVRPFASLVGLCQRLYLWNSWVLTLDSQAPCLKFLGVTELCTSHTQNNTSDMYNTGMPPQWKL